MNLGYNIKVLYVYILIVGIPMSAYFKRRSNFTLVWTISIYGSETVNFFHWFVIARYFINKTKLVLTESYCCHVRIQNAGMGTNTARFILRALVTLISYLFFYGRIIYVRRTSIIYVCLSITPSCLLRITIQ